MYAVSNVIDLLDAEAQRKNLPTLIPGDTVKVGTRFGHGVSQSDCVVIAQTTQSIPQRGSHPTAGTVVVVSLNCDPHIASATNPGYSAASPQGRADAAASQAAK